MFQRSKHTNGFQDSEDESYEDGNVIYDLKSSVAHIQDYNSPGNLVAMINVEKSYHKESVVSKSSWLDIEVISRENDGICTIMEKEVLF